MIAQLEVFAQEASSEAKRQQDARIVLGWYQDHTGTRYECAKALGMLPTTCLPRATELKKAGFLTPIPGVRKGTGLGGTSAALIVTKAGREMYRSGLPIPRPKKSKAA